ncbi:MAG: hypothetical protein JNL83_24505 [Myxococcales bacterium]|nr:hypothetical protein [Myxococcales bacterium]
MRIGSTSTRTISATRTALPSEVDPLTITQRDLGASLRAHHSDARKPRLPSREETEDTVPFELVDPVNASATVRDLPAATGSACRRRAQIAIAASFVLALAASVGAALS